MKLLSIAISTIALTACALPPKYTAEKLPPGATFVPLKNPSFNVDDKGRFPGWAAMEHSQSGSYTFDADTTRAHSSPTSLRIRRIGAEPWGLVEQVITIPPDWLGKTVRLGGYLRTEGADGGGALLIQTRAAGGSPLTYDHMNAGRPTGTQDWKRYSVEVKIPKEAKGLMVGAMLDGNGALWVDDLSLVLVDK